MPFDSNRTLFFSLCYHLLNNLAKWMTYIMKWNGKFCWWNSNIPQIYFKCKSLSHLHIKDGTLFNRAFPLATWRLNGFNCFASIQRLFIADNFSHFFHLICMLFIENWPIGMIPQIIIYSIGCWMLECFREQFNSCDIW